MLSDYTINGTAGNDTIVVDVTGNAGLYFYEVDVNGTHQELGPINPLGQNQVNVDGLEGNDLIQIKREYSLDFMQVFGGPGNDEFEIAHGNFGGDIDGDVYVNEGDGGGNDSLIINDTSTGTFQHDTIHFTQDLSLYQIAADETLNDATVHFLANVENVTLNRSGQDDVVYLDSIPPCNLTVNLGDGNNVVKYGGDAKTLFGTVYPATINGGVNTDKVVFDDSGGGTTGRDFELNDTAVMNQTLSGIEQVEFDTRAATGGTSPNMFFMTGKPLGVNSITINGGPAVFSIGALDAPVDVGAFGVQLTLNVYLEMYIYDQQSTSEPESFLLDAPQSTTQRVTKESFSATMTVPTLGLSIVGGSTNDTFIVAGTSQYSSIYLDGGGGDDQCSTGGGDDLDAAFRGGYFKFHGGPGNDLFDLNDSADQTGDLDADYYLDSNGLAKGASPGYNGNYLVQYDSSTDRIFLVGDNDPNVITFSGFPNQQIALNGGGGNDYFTDYTGAGLQGAQGTYSISGGAGSDTIELDDTNPNSLSITDYTFNVGSVSYMSGPTLLGSVGYDATVESLSVDESEVGTTTHLNAVGTGNLKVSVSARGGNDTVVAGGGDFESGHFNLNNITLLGGAGADSIEFDDHLDNADGVESETYDWSMFAISKAGAGFNYSAFETQRLDAAGLDTGPVLIAATVNLNSTSSFIANTTIVGADTRPCTVNVGTGNLVQLAGAINIQMGSGSSDTVNISDSTTADSTFSMNSTQITKVGGGFMPAITYSGVDSMNLSCGSGNDSVDVFQTPVGLTFSANGNAGNDAFVVGAAIMDSLFGTVAVSGGAGTDSLQFGSGFGSTFKDETLTSNSFAIAGEGTQFYDTIESIMLWQPSGGSQLNITSLSVPISITGQGGDDAITIGGGNLNANIGFLTGIAFNGGSGNDSVTYDDRFGTTDDRYDIDAGYLTKTSTIGLQQSFTTLTGVESQTLLANAGKNVVAVHGGNVGVNTGSETGPTGDQLVVDNSSHTAFVKIVGSDHVKTVLLSATTLQIPTGVTLDVTTGLTFPNSVIDLAGGALLLRSAVGMSQAAIRGSTLSGYAGGAWNGTNAGGAINSSLAHGSALNDDVGYGLGSQIAIGTIGGFAINPTDTLVRYTLAGDANLDAKVDTLDFNTLAGNFGGNGKVWTAADFNYDSVVDTLDFNALAGTFGQSVAAGAFLRIPGVAADGPFSKREITVEELLREGRPGAATNSGLLDSGKRDRGST